MAKHIWYVSVVGENVSYYFAFSKKSKAFQASHSISEQLRAYGITDVNVDVERLAVDEQPSMAELNDIVSDYQNPAV